MNMRPPQIGDSSMCCHLQATDNKVLPAQHEPEEPAHTQALTQRLLRKLGLHVVFDLPVQRV